MGPICLLCDRSFLSDGALLQHKQDSPAHVEFFHCSNCNRSFSSKEALEQHRRDSPAHAESFGCNDCNRSFGSKEALEQHRRDSPAHVESFDCDNCDWSSGSDQALEQHLRDSHAESFNCDDCDRSFGSKEALEQHLRDAPAHHLAPETPLDAFFRSFRTFEYDPSQPPATSYARLQSHKGWRREDPASADAWHRYQDALEEELRLWYGEEDNLAAWHTLCHAIGIEPPPQTCNQCEKAVRRTHVNIVDLTEWGRRRGSVANQVQTFRDVESLRAYTVRTSKFFRPPLDQSHSNFVLRHLLRRILS